MKRLRACIRGSKYPQISEALFPGHMRTFQTVPYMSLGIRTSVGYVMTFKKRTTGILNRKYTDSEYTSLKIVQYPT